MKKFSKAKALKIPLKMIIIEISCKKYFLKMMILEQ